MPQDAATTLWDSLREIYQFMSPRRRRQFYMVILLMLVGAIVEVASIGAVLPFLSLLADPGAIDRLPPLARLFEGIGAESQSERLVAAATGFALLASLAGIVRLRLAWVSQYFVYRLGHDLAVGIQRRVLLQPYSFHIGHNTSTLLSSLEKVHALVFNVLLQLMQAAVAVVISIFIVLGLLYIDPFTAITAAVAFSVIYILVSLVTRRRLARNSAVLGVGIDERIKIVQESLGGIRDLIIDGSQAVYLDAFRRIDDGLTIARANNTFIGAAPRFVIEAFGMILIAGLAVVLSARQGGFAAAIPILGALALGAQRLLPLLQQIYFGWSTATGHNSIVGQVLWLLRLPDSEMPSAADVEPLPFRDCLTVRDVTFAYGDRKNPALRDVNLDIPRGCRIALIGKTGSGKSTLADLLMGLLEPTRGEILVDGVRLTGEARRRWQRSIAHVPQAIFLSDDSIARNIAFGVPEEKVDLDRVIDAARRAELDEFVRSLPDGYQTFVGERGIRLSGGQRQRLAIARAIYKQAPILVLDEATSALDDATETAVMHALDTLGQEGRTIIMIAHRLSTVARADIVARLDNGRLVEVGSHTEVLGALKTKAG